MNYSYVSLDPEKESAENNRCRIYEQRMENAIGGTKGKSLGMVKGFFFGAATYALINGKATCWPISKTTAWRWALIFGASLYGYYSGEAAGASIYGDSTHYSYLRNNRSAFEKGMIGFDPTDATSVQENEN